MILTKEEFEKKLDIIRYSYENSGQEVFYITYQIDNTIDYQCYVSDKALFHRNGEITYVNCSKIILEEVDDDFDGGNIEDGLYDIRFDKTGAYCYDYEKSMIKKITKKREKIK